MQNPKSQAQQRRLQATKDHLCRESKCKASSGPVISSCAAKSEKIEYKGGWQGIDPSQVDVNETGVELMPIIRGRILHFFDQIKDARAIDGYNIGEHLPGPVRDDLGPGKRYSDIKQILRELQIADNAGFNHKLWSTMQQRYCDSSLGNFVIPVISFTRTNTRAPIMTNRVIISHPEDAGRIARGHLKKMPDQAIFLHTGVLTQLDTDRWRVQRGHLNEAFMPFQSLKRVFPISRGRTVKSVQRLRDMVTASYTDPDSEDGVVQINEFLLFETMAQLQMVMFGMTEEEMEKSNERVRAAFAYLLETTGGTGSGSAENMDMMQVARSAGRVFKFLGEFLALAPRTIGVREVAGHGETQPVDQPIRGPLTARILDISEDMEEQMMNAATFVFAGHDTTANTMTWLLFELAQNKDIQRRLQAETDELFARLDGKPLQYEHLFTTPFLTRCLSESMRLWPVVPNGTFRQLLHDDHVQGPGGTKVKLKKGTYVQIPNWMRHRSKELWGADAHVFNPDRDWKEYELWDEKVFRGFNPSSERFSPFTYGPRDCMGKNFAQMEMRVILLHLLHHFEFSLGKITAAYKREDFLGVNRATLGPQDIGEDPDKPAKLGMYLKIHPRTAAAAPTPKL